MQRLGTVGLGLVALGCSGLLPEPTVVFANPTDAPITFTAADRTHTVQGGTLARVGLPYDGVWDVAVDGAVLGQVDLTRGPHWRDLKMFDLSGQGCWVLVDASAAYFSDHLGIRTPPGPPHVARTWRGVHQVEHGVGGVENCQTDLCREWGEGGRYVLPDETWPRPRGRNPNPTVRRLLSVDCAQLDDPGWEASLVAREIEALASIGLDVDPSTPAHDP